jgi:hypothetical protein
MIIEIEVPERKRRMGRIYGVNWEVELMGWGGKRHPTRAKGRS